MVEMIVAKEIYSRDDLRELLNCFLQLNSPNYHGIIVRAFTEIWDAVFSLRVKCSSPKLHLPHNSRVFSGLVLQQRRDRSIAAEDISKR
ncbi:Transcription repressor OFP6 [Camellia lanceoleosa]|uniref:Transcription repressor OFP6 n=1 Tax=Camellia lanceoleosa TaxID=1840588 RepID=A0ACC0G7P3_9ERIC|nr:Transcription repressor OFP6 [Camellia lanceoleosa]